MCHFYCQVHFSEMLKISKNSGHIHNRKQSDDVSGCAILRFASTMQMKGWIKNLSAETGAHANMNSGLPHFAGAQSGLGLVD
jgi:hypothetical protein